MKQNESVLNDQTGNNFVEASSELVKREDIPPFTVVTIQEKGSFIAFGQVMLTDFQSEEKCKEDIEKRDWNLIASFSMLLASANKSLVDKLVNNEKENNNG